MSINQRLLIALVTKYPRQLSSYFKVLPSKGITVLDISTGETFATFDTFAAEAAKSLSYSILESGKLTDKVLKRTDIPYYHTSFEVSTRY